MKLIRKWIGLLFFTLSLPVAALEIIDDVGTSITFTSPPQRIISLTPNLTELAFAAGMGSRMVAVSAY
ncbi:MAG: cobalamin-binding protein, partial [Candidatus Nitrotoga sp.]